MNVALSLPGLITASAYAAGAMWIVRCDRVARGGDWISLRGLGSYLATLPVSFLCERCGRKLDCRRNRDMAGAIGGSAVLVYGIVAGAVLLGRCAVSLTAAR